MREAVISCPLRSPVAREAGALAPLLPEEFGAQVLGALLKRSGLPPDLVEDVIVGNQAVPARVARHCALLGGLPVEVPGVAVTRGCASGLEAVIRAAHAVQMGSNDVLVAGGVESYTRAPYLLDKPSEPYQRRPPGFVSAETRGDFGLPELGLNTSMGMTAENVAAAYGITRDVQDEFALESQRRADRAVRANLFEDEIVPIQLQGDRHGGPSAFAMDECPRPNTSLEALRRLRPLFKRDGTVTAGNACKRADGAAMMIVSSEAAAHRYELQPVARLVASASVGVEPNLMGIAPIAAVRTALQKARLSVDDIAVTELNEAFAAQVIPVIREIGVPPERVNPNGGAIAFGHPTGATGAILTAKLLYELRRRQARYGMVTMCVGGGMGTAAIFERIS